MEPNEKLLTMGSIFKDTNKNRILNIGDYISDNFSKIDGFDFRWTSLITNNPLLFEDVDYMRIKDYVDSRITEDEIQAYKRGELRELYSTLENMLICNLIYYDRIISYCTMVFMHYVRINDELYKHGLDKVPYMLNLTPTQIWCAALSSTNSTEWELNYAWNIFKNKKITTLPIPESDKSIIEVSWQQLYKNIAFAKFQEYNAIRCGTSGFRQNFISDKTSNRKLSQVCTKFTTTSVAISEQQLETINEYAKTVDSVKNKLYAILDKCLNILFNGDSSQYSIYIFTNEFFIYTSKFTIKVSKSPLGVISKDYLANSYECFAAEEFLIPSNKTQIEWAKMKIPQHFEYDKNILKSLLLNMIMSNFREIVCIKKMNDFGTTSKITFKGVFNNVNMIEEFMFNNRTIKTVTKILSKRNAASYIVERGYYVFGIEKDILSLLEHETITKKMLVAHYNNYCIPVMQHMFDVIAMHNMSKNDIIDVVISGHINPNKLNNHNIKYTSISVIDTKEIMSKGLKQQNKNLLNKKSYWKAVDD